MELLLATTQALHPAPGESVAIAGGQALNDRGQHGIERGINAANFAGSI